MSSRRKLRPCSRVTNRVPGAKANSTSPPPQPVAGPLPVPAGAQPAYEELLLFFNESPDLLCIAGFDGIFKRLNPAWEPALGWTREELQARSFLDFVHPDDRPATLVEIDTLAAGNRTISFENRYLCKDGSWKWLQWTASPLHGRREIYAIARDVTRQKQLEEEILATLDHERERAGRDLHDSLGPHLAAISYAASFLEKELREHDPARSAKAERIRGMAGDAISLARNLARAIFPVHVDAAGLGIALEELAHTTSLQTGMSVSFCETGDAPIGNPQAEMQLYRIGQEALSNAAKHGGATKITILLNRNEDTLRLTIADNGKGMGPSPSGTQGMGLHSMSHRARALGGSLEIESRADKGTVVSCRIPNRPAPPSPPAS